MAIAGLRGTGDWGTDERPKNFRETILWRNPNGKAPLFAMMARAKKETTDDPEFAWWEEEQAPLVLQVNAAATTGDTALTVDTADYDARELVSGDFLLIQGVTSTAYDNEIVEVSSTPSASNSFTVSRGAAGTTADSIASGDYLTKVGSAFAEGVGAPDATTRNPTKYYNYTQIFRTKYEITNTAKETRARTGDALKNDKKRRMFDHSSSLEYAILMGKRWEGTGSNGKPKRTTGGLIEFLSTAVTQGYTHCIKVFSTTPDEDDILDAIYPVFNWESEGAGDERVVLCGNVFLNTLNKIAKDSNSTRINFDKTIEMWGMNLQRWIFPQGTIFLRTHPLMNVHPLFKKGAFVLNGAGLIWRPLRNRDTKMRDNIQQNDADAQEGEWLTEGGVEFHHLPTMAYLEVP